MTTSIGKEWLENYANALQQADTDAIARLFHPGFSYIVNDKLHEASSSFSQQDTWKFIFSKIQFKSAQGYNLIETYPGHIIYHEVLKICIKFSGEELEGHFGDRAVVNSDGKMLMINRLADPAYFARLTAALDAQ
jgi:hypothetical protein